MNAAQMLESPRKAYLLWGIEPEFDVDNPARALRALEQAETVIAVASFATDSLRAVADVILPLAPHAESEGSLVNFDGGFMAFAAAGKASGDARSGWKILRRLGGELAIEGIAQVDLGAVQADLRRALEHGGVTASEVALRDATVSQGLYRIGEVAMYSVDPLCRRATPLQETAQAQSRFVGLNPADAARLGLAEGALARVRQDEDPTAGWAEVEVLVTERVPAGGVWLRSATCDARLLGHAVAPVVVEPATGGLA